MRLNVTINGEPRSFDGPLTVAGLLAALDLPPTKIAVERNLEIVPKSTFGAVAVSDGDRFEIVRFIGGG